jgi:hypothetical protein
MSAKINRWLPSRLRDAFRDTRSLTKVNRKNLTIERLERRDQPSYGWLPRPRPCPPPPPPPPPGPCDPGCLDTVVAGKVYHDKNSNGVFDGNDSGIGGVVVQWRLLV